MSINRTIRTLTAPPEVEVLGAPMLAFIDNIRADAISDLLERHAIVDIQPDKWYPAQKWLNVMNEMIDRPDVSMNFVAIGLSVAEQVVLPPGMEDASLEDILNLWDQVYHMQHRGGDIGSVEVKKIAPGHIKTTHRHLYPDDLTYGLAYGWCRRFLPSGTDFIVEYDGDIPKLDDGGTETIIHIRWDE